MTGRGLAFDPGFTDVCRVTAPVPPGGRRSFHVTVITTYLQCTPRAADVTPRMPRCLHSSAPPLPAGHYRTKLVVEGLRSATVDLPPSVTVTLR